MIFNLPDSSKINHAHPEPNLEVAAAANSDLNFSMLPKDAVISCIVFSEGPVCLADKFSQKKLWFHAPPALFRALAEYLEIFANNCSSDDSEIFSATMASLIALIYAA
ncbi:hypothetical protein D3C87_1254590 [compost metagenome]